jgi:hypothetical protein
VEGGTLERKTVLYYSSSPSPALAHGFPAESSRVIIKNKKPQVDRTYTIFVHTFKFTKTSPASYLYPKSIVISHRPAYWYKPTTAERRTFIVFVFYCGFFFFLFFNSRAPKLGAATAERIFFIHPSCPPALPKACTRYQGQRPPRAHDVRQTAFFYINSQIKKKKKKQFSRKQHRTV